MRFTRRLRERGALTVAVLAAIGAVASCSSEDRAGVPSPLDGSTDSASVPPVDAGDAQAPARDASAVDAAPLPIVCAAPPCATALVTTLGGYYANDNGQGFCALLQDGTVACWGANVSGQLGRGDDAGASEGSSRAARVVGLENVTALDHTCALDQDGAMWCWGTGPFLRDATYKPSTERVPVKLDVPRATHIGVGRLLACASTDEGILCWGSNQDGQLGPFSTTPRYNWHAPQEITLPPGAPVRQIAIGSATIFVREDGSVVSLGANPPLGRVSSLSPDPNALNLALDGVFAVDLAIDNVCAAAGGTGFCWGAALPGAIDKLNRAYPRGLVTPEPIVEVATTPTVTFTGTATVPYRWCAAAVSGTVYCWGFNESGQAGDGTKVFAPDPVAVVGLPERAASVRTTRDTTCALLTNGKVYCWGSNYDGQLGNRKNRGVALVPEEVILP